MSETQNLPSAAPLPAGSASDTAAGQTLLATEKLVKEYGHRRVVNGDEAAVNPALEGTKFGAWHVAAVAPGQSVTLGLVLSHGALAAPFAEHDVVLAQRQAEADAFYEALQPGISAGLVQLTPVQYARQELLDALCPHFQGNIPKKDWLEILSDEDLLPNH